MSFEEGYKPIIIYPTPQANRLIVVGSAKRQHLDDKDITDKFVELVIPEIDEEFEFGFGFVDFRMDKIRWSYVNSESRVHKFSYEDIHHIQGNIHDLSNIVGQNREKQKERMISNLRATRLGVNLVEKLNHPLIWVSNLANSAIVCVSRRFLLDYFNGNIQYKPNVTEELPEKERELLELYQRWNAYYQEPVDRNKIMGILGSVVRFVGQNLDYGFNFQQLRDFVSGLIKKVASEEKYELAAQILEDSKELERLIVLVESLARH